MYVPSDLHNVQTIIYIHFFFFLIQFVFTILCGSEASFVFIYSKFELKNTLWRDGCLQY